LEPLASWYTDQTTWRDLASTRNTVPLPRLNELVVPTAANLFTVSASMGLVGGSLSLSALAAGFSGAGGGGKISSSFACRLSPTRSVRKASASLGSVTTWNKWSF